MCLVFRERREQKQDLNDWLKGQQSTSNFYLIECVCVCVCVWRASSQDKKCLQYLVVGFFLLPLGGCGTAFGQGWRHRWIRSAEGWEPSRS